MANIEHESSRWRFKTSNAQELVRNLFLTSSGRFGSRNVGRRVSVQGCEHGFLSARSIDMHGSGI